MEALDRHDLAHHHVPDDRVELEDDDPGVHQAHKNGVTPAGNGGLRPVGRLHALQRAGGLRSGLAFRVVALGFTAAVGLQSGMRRAAMRPNSMHGKDGRRTSGSTIFFRECTATLCVQNLQATPPQDLPQPLGAADKPLDTHLTPQTGKGGDLHQSAVLLIGDEEGVRPLIIQELQVGAVRVR